jgi:lipoprotein-releasing system ATP-binding protein
MSQANPQTHATGTEAILRATGIRRNFHIGDSTLPVLKGADLTLRPGEFVAIEGRSGSGKSTLLHILSGLDAADEGTIEYQGHQIGGLARSTVGMYWRSFVFKRPFAYLHDLLAISQMTSVGKADRQLASIRNTQFGFVFQFYHLLPELTVLENTLLAPMIENSWFAFRAKRKEMRARAEQVLADLGMAHRLKHRPGQLSGGERQRVAIARALMNSPRVLFADEPTGNLDAETGRQIMNLLEGLHQKSGQTIVMVTHDRALAREADRVLVLKDGKLEKAE